MFDKSTNQAPQGIADTDEEPIDVEMPDEEPEEGAEDEPTGSAGLDHDENLAEHIPEDALRKIASELDAEIQMDIAARSDWETHRPLCAVFTLGFEEAVRRGLAQIDEAALL